MNDPDLAELPRLSEVVRVKLLQLRQRVRSHDELIVVLVREGRPDLEHFDLGRAHGIGVWVVQRITEEGFNALSPSSLVDSLMAARTYCSFFRQIGGQAGGEGECQSGELPGSSG